MNVISCQLIEKVGGNQTAFEVSHPQPLLKKIFKISLKYFYYFYGYLIW